MGVYLEGNYIFVTPGGKAFLVSSNFVNYFELGRKGVTDYYLEARVEKDAFLVSGTLRDSSGAQLCNLQDNNLENVSGDCVFEPLANSGYQVVHKGSAIFRLSLVDRNVCLLEGRFYDSAGNLVAQGDEKGLQILKGPAVLGKSGNSLGIVLAD